jgi:metal-dependent amidase/aminoacylase/carboxypeptidase family protein
MTLVSLLHEAEELHPAVVRLRRAIHRHPELGLHLPRTQAAILEGLDGLGLQVRKGDRLTSVVAALARANALPPRGHGRPARGRGDGGRVRLGG